MAAMPTRARLISFDCFRLRFIIARFRLTASTRRRYESTNYGNIFAKLARNVSMPTNFHWIATPKMKV